MATRKTDNLRAAFESAGMKYECIRQSDIIMLRAILERHLESHSHFQMRTTAPKMKFDRAGLIYARIYVDGPYFKKRQGIEFEQNGFIGFCGWADDSNLRPFHDAFLEWIQWFKGKNEI
jgi:hypothetical protein